MVGSLQLEFAERTTIVSVCNRSGAPDESVRFIPAVGDDVRISSTRIREMTSTRPSRRLYKALESLALSPEILVELVQHRRQHRRQGGQYTEYS